MNVFLAIDFIRFLTNALGRRWFCSEMRVAKAFFGTLETILWGRCLAFGVWCFLACASGRHLFCSEILFAKAVSGTGNGVFSLFCSEPFVAGAPLGTGEGVQRARTEDEDRVSLFRATRHASVPRNRQKRLWKWIGSRSVSFVPNRLL